MLQSSTSEERNLFSFGTHKHLGLGTMNIGMPISLSSVLHLTVDVVDTNVPFLLGFDNIERYGVVVDTDKFPPSSTFKG